MDENPYKSPETRCGQRAFNWATVKRWATVAFLSCLGISGVANGILGATGLLPWVDGRLNSIIFLFMWALALTAAYQHASQSRR
jgi:hypothetical protein